MTRRLPGDGNEVAGEFVIPRPVPFARGPRDRDTGAPGAPRVKFRRPRVHGHFTLRRQVLQRDAGRRKSWIPAPRVRWACNSDSGAGATPQGIDVGVRENGGIRHGRTPRSAPGRHRHRSGHRRCARHRAGAALAGAARRAHDHRGRQHRAARGDRQRTPPARAPRPCRAAPPGARRRAPPSRTAEHRPRRARRRRVGRTLQAQGPPRPPPLSREPRTGAGRQRRGGGDRGQGPRARGSAHRRRPRSAHQHRPGTRSGRALRCAVSAA